MAKNYNEDEVWKRYLEMNKHQAERIRDVYGLVPAEELEKTQKELDPETLRNMERCADFVARMLIKYGRRVGSEQSGHDGLEKSLRKSHKKWQGFSFTG